MNEPHSEETSASEGQTKENKVRKKRVGQFLGIEMSAPQGMKNPLMVFILLIASNLVLLFLLSKAF